MARAAQARLAAGSAAGEPIDAFSQKLRNSLISSDLSNTASAPSRRHCARFARVAALVSAITVRPFFSGASHDSTPSPVPCCRNRSTTASRQASSCACSHEIASASLYHHLASRYGDAGRPSWADEEYTAGTADRDLAAILGVPLGSAVLVVRRTAFVADGQAAEFVESFVRADAYRVKITVLPANGDGTPHPVPALADNPR